MATAPELSTEIKLKGSREHQIRQMIENSYGSREWREYRTDSPRRGRAVIANFSLFKDEEIKERIGSKKDVEALQIMLGDKLKFDVQTWDLNGVNAHTFLKMVEEESKNANHRNGDCFLMVIMTHGFTNGTLCAYEGAFNLDNVINLFTGDRCSPLRGKPKIFIVQACRGAEGQPGVYVAKSGSQPRKMISLPVHSDILIAKSQSEGYYSLRHPQNGSYFIQSLCYALDKDFMKRDEEKDDILQILTFASYCVAYYEFIETKTIEFKSGGVQSDVGGGEMVKVLEKGDMVGAVEGLEVKTDLESDTNVFTKPSYTKSILSVTERMVKQQPTVISTLLQLFYLRNKEIKP
ncbi:caspase-3-like [Hetaerina americana]|uniref:caspase-3-like n=1 Tax=Hetaerina americana TaxID=62018 RepID=UPI003A7F5FC9